MFRLPHDATAEQKLFRLYTEVMVVYAECRARTTSIPWFWNILVNFMAMSNTYSKNCHTFLLEMILCMQQWPWLFTLLCFHVSALEELLSVCFDLKKLSLEHCTLTQSVCSHIANNTSLETLNLAMCYGLCHSYLVNILTHCKRWETGELKVLSEQGLVVDSLP